MIHESVFKLIQNHFVYLIDEYDMRLVQWFEDARGYGYYKIRLRSSTHVLEFLYDSPFIGSWVGTTASRHVFQEILLAEFLDPERVFPDASGLADRLVKMLPLDSIDFQLERLSRLGWQPYLDQLMGLDLYKDEDALIASAEYPWMVRKNEWREY
jgi:hypothetical protein